MTAPCFKIGSVAIPAGAVAAARKYGSLVDGIAAQYTNPITGGKLTGTALLLKLSKGENAFQMGGSPSSAGARGATQFTPGSRQVAISKYGVDPWKNYDQAFHAAALHLLGKINGSTGLHGYNPGMASYPSYILNQRVGPVSGGTTGTSAASVSAPSQKSVTATGSATVSSALPDTGASTGLADLLASLSQSQRQPAGGMQLQSPVTSADQRYGAPQVMPSGITGQSSSGVAEQLSALAGASGGVVPPVASQTATATATGTTTGLSASKPTAGAKATLAWARSRIGTSETAGANRGPRIDSWEKAFGMSGQPWCAIFTSLAVTKGGAPAIARTASVGAVRGQAMTGQGGYQKGFVDPARAHAGDLILFGNDHIGLVESVSAKGITMIAGNDSNRVQRRVVAPGSGDIVRPRYK